MRKPPSGWPQISSSVYYDDAGAAIDWLCTVFGFEVRIKIVGDNGRVDHSEITYGEGLVMVSEASKPRKEKWAYRRSPSSVSGANTQNMMVFVDDVDAHCEHARAHGAMIISEPTTNDYGDDYWTDRSYEVQDLGGHHWWFCQRLREPKPKP